MSSLENASFVESAISELVGNHTVVEVPFVPNVVNPLSVYIQSSKQEKAYSRFEVCQCK